jgi:hypothetical protein
MKNLHRINWKPMIKRREEAMEIDEQNRKGLEQEGDSLPEGKNSLIVVQEANEDKQAVCLPQAEQQNLPMPTTLPETNVAEPIVPASDNLQPAEQQELNLDPSGAEKEVNSTGTGFAPPQEEEEARSMDVAEQEVVSSVPMMEEEQQAVLAAAPLRLLVSGRPLPACLEEEEMDEGTNDNNVISIPDDGQSSDLGSLAMVEKIITFIV